MILPELYYKRAYMRFNDISEWMRKCEMLENASVDRESIFKCIHINVAKDFNLNSALCNFCAPKWNYNLF